MQGAHIFQNTLFREVSKLIHYFDVKGAPIFQNTLFRGVQPFIIILMRRVHKYFRILYSGGVPKLIQLHYFDAKDAQIFQNTFFLGERTHSLLF